MGRTGGRDDADVDQVRAWCDPGICAARSGAVTRDEAGDVRTVPARVGRCNEHSAAAGREVDRGDDPAQKVRVRRDTTVEDRDTDPLAGNSELTPGRRRSDLEDAGARRERRTIDGIECRGNDLIGRDVRDVWVVGERQNLGAGEDRGRSADDRKPATDLPVRSLHRRGGALGVMTVVQLDGGPDDDREVVHGFGLREREQGSADLGIRMGLRSRRGRLRRRHDDGCQTQPRPAHAHPSPSAHATPPTRRPAAFHPVGR